MNDSHHKPGVGHIRTGAGLCMLFAALAAGGPVLADDDHRRGRGYGHGEDHRHDRGHRHCRRDRHSHVSNYYYQQAEPVVVYREQPVIVERVVERVVVAQPVYPAYPAFGAPAQAYGGGYGHPNRVVTAAMLGAAGGLLGAQVGRGDGRVAATAAGAVAGWVLGSNLGR